MKYKLALTVIIVFFSQFCVGQTLNLAGTWTLVKHITTFNNDKNFDCMKLMDGATVQMKVNADGKYEIISTDKKGKRNSTIGMWKVSPDNKKLTLYKNEFVPKNSNGTIADRTFDIVKFTATEFQFKENLCTEEFEGVSFYKRIK